jgi:hypothetical protein
VVICSISDTQWLIVKVRAADCHHHIGHCDTACRL